MPRYGLLGGLVLAAAIGSAAPIGRPAGRADAADAQAAPDYDAAFVDVKAPEKVAAHEVFRVAITMRNTGARPWGSWPLRLRTVNPPNNTRWGTSYILVAQGRSVNSGQEYTFSSRLKAPAQPGRGVFQWQLCKDGKTWFGQVTPARTIEVTARPSAPATAPAAPERTSDGKKVLTFADFEYLGSFKPPMTVGQARGAFSATGLTLRKTAGGPDRMLMNYTHPAQVLFEVEVPELVRLADGKHAALHTAKLVRTWGAVTASRPGMQAISPNGGFAWDEATRTLYWTWFHGYKTGPAPPVLAATKLADDGGMTSSGPWHVSVPGGLYKSYWGGVIRLPKAFAEKYTSGRTLALGFGGYYSICASASRGPALGAIGRPDPAAQTVAVTEMLYSTNRSPAPRDGDYFSANCGYWHDDPTGPQRGTWTFDDMCRAGAFVDAAGGHAYVAFVRLGTGRLGYDFGAITHAGESQYWYFYDPADLGRAAKGEKKPWTIIPTSMAKVTYPLGRSVTGACYDAGPRRLYLCTSSAYARGREHYPIVHVYGVK